VYCSHPVRRLREEPIEESVDLVVELDGAGRGALDDAVAAAEGAVEAALGLGAYRVAVPGSGVDALCSALPADGVERVETAATLSLPVDDDSVKGGEGE